MHDTSPAAPLAGLRILDLTRLLPGPLATQHLADFGADVIKIEDTGPGDYARTMGAMGGESSYFYQIVNRNKTAIRLDLKQAAGREIFLRLVASADAVIEGFRPGVMEKLGLSHAALSAVNPRIVLTRISGYGQTGPYALRAGHDLNYTGYAGVLDQMGGAGEAPALSNLQIGDLLGGTLTAVVGTLIALIDARAGGPGREVDVSMTDATLAHAIFPLAQLLAQGGVRPRGEDLLTGGVPCYGVYETADGRHMAVGALEEKFWHQVCDTLERPDLKPAHLAQGAAAAAARAELAAIFRRRTQAEWVAVFDPVDCCVTPVLRLEESLADPQIRAREMVRDVGGVLQFGPLCRLSGHVPAPARPAPAAGADTVQVLGALGYTGEEIEALKKQSVI